jgi:hypothetical protein
MSILDTDIYRQCNIFNDVQKHPPETVGVLLFDPHQNFEPPVG